jgi:peptide/nickel transport system substrate-binding protein
MKKSIFIVLSGLILLSMLLSACTPAATTTPAATEAAQAETAVPPTAVPATAVPPTAVPPTEAAPARTTLVLADQDAYTSQDPFTNAWHSSPSYSEFATLTTLNIDLSGYVGYLAESWTISDDSKTITFKLKPGLTFQDGTPVNSEAIKYNVDKYMDETLAAPGGGDLRSVLDNFEIIDDLTFAFHLTAPYAPFFNNISSSIEIVSPTAYELYGPDNFSMHLVGAGAWTVSEVVPESYIHYVANPDFTWAPSEIYSNTGPEQIPEFEIRFMSDPEVVYASLETGEVTIAVVPPVHLADARANTNITLVEAVETTLHYLGMNNQFAPLDDIKVRTAINYALNRQEIIDGAYEGEGIVSYGALTPAEIDFDPTVEDYAKATSDDPSMAMQILEEDGYTMNADGIYEKDGKPLEFSLMVEPNAVFQRATEIVQSQLADVGIKINIELTENTAIREATVNGTHQMIWWTYGQLDPAIFTYIFHSSRIGASNRNRVVDTTLDGLLDQADQTLDPVARKAVVRDICIYLADHHFHIPLFTLKSYVGYRNDQITGLKFDVLGGYYELDATLLP